MFNVAYGEIMIEVKAWYFFLEEILESQIKSKILQISYFKH